VGGRPPHRVTRRLAQTNEYVLVFGNDLQVLLEKHEVSLEAAAKHQGARDGIECVEAEDRDAARSTRSVTLLNHLDISGAYPFKAPIQLVYIHI
jgi:hypothetical protein